MKIGMSFPVTGFLNFNKKSKNNYSDTKIKTSPVSDVFEKAKMNSSSPSFGLSMNPYYKSDRKKILDTVYKAALAAGMIVEGGEISNLSQDDCERYANQISKNWKYFKQAPYMLESVFGIKLPEEYQSLPEKEQRNVLGNIMKDIMSVCKKNYYPERNYDMTHLPLEPKLHRMIRTILFPWNTQIRLVSTKDLEKGYRAYTNFSNLHSKINEISENIDDYLPGVIENREKKTIESEKEESDKFDSQPDTNIQGGKQLNNNPEKNQKSYSGDKLFEEKINQVLSDLSDSISTFSRQVSKHGNRPVSRKEIDDLNEKLFNLRKMLIIAENYREQAKKEFNEAKQKFEADSSVYQNRINHTNAGTNLRFCDVNVDRIKNEISAFSTELQRLKSVYPYENISQIESQINKTSIMINEAEKQRDLLRKMLQANTEINSPTVMKKDKELQNLEYIIERSKFKFHELVDKYYTVLHGIAFID